MRVVLYSPLASGSLYVVDAPLRTSTKDSEFDSILSVFTADANVEGAVTCLAYNDDVNGSSTHSEVIVQAVSDQVYYILATPKDNSGNLGDRLGAFKLSTYPATAQSMCEFDCSNSENVTSCWCQANDKDQTYMGHFQWHCEACEKNGTFCLLNSVETVVYGADGVPVNSKHCYWFTKGFDSKTICIYSDNTSTDDGPTLYIVNDEACTTIPDDSCCTSNTFDCSIIEPGALFNYCESEGFVGVFLTEKLLVRDFVELESCECYRYASDSLALDPLGKWWILGVVIASALMA